MTLSLSDTECDRVTDRDPTDCSVSRDWVFWRRVSEIFFKILFYFKILLENLFIRAIKLLRGNSSRLHYYSLYASVCILTYMYTRLTKNDY